MLTRSLPNTDTQVEGRTLTGYAFHWNRASRVTDDGRNFYQEAFAPRSADKTLLERSKPFPLGYLHTYTAESKPLGSVRFEADSQGLVFNATLSQTRASDEMLNLVKDGAVTDVSIGFQSYKHAKQTDGTILRTEIGLVELSLAPTGMGQHQGAEVLAVRSHELQSRLALSQRLAALKLWSPDA